MGEAAPPVETSAERRLEEEEGGRVKGVPLWHVHR
jgi:hypothetical protein